MDTEINELDATAPVGPSFVNRLFAEAWGTFILVFSFVGAILFATINQLQPNGSGMLGAAFALGFGVLVASYTVGSISGGHFNPAITFGLALSGRASWKDVPGYIVAQIIGGAIASSILFIIAANG
jgi:aquaporin Z